MSMMKTFPLCLAVVLSFVLENSARQYQSIPTNTLKTKQFPQGVYLTTKLDFYNPLFALNVLNHYFDSFNLSMNSGNLIVQSEKRCPIVGGGANWKYTYSVPISYTDLNDIPMPNDNSLYLDFQNKRKTLMYFKSFDPPVPISQVINKVNEFFNAAGKLSQKNWFYVSGYDFTTPNSTFREIWLNKAPPYQRSSCPPDDSNVQNLCSKRSSYKCPNTTYSFHEELETRQMSMYIVTGSSNTSFMQQYKNNFKYFQGSNSDKLRMKRTVPVIIKVTLFPSNTSKSLKKYQMQFFVNNNSPPCPINKTVYLKKISDIEVYVKVFNGYFSFDIEFLYKKFAQELTSKNLPYVTGQYYKSVFRGMGPILGSRLELWVLKKQIKCTQLCICPVS